MKTDDKKKILLKTLAIKIKDLRGNKSQFLLSSEYDISTSIISTVERGLKDPQFTTVFKLAEALGVRPYKFIKLIEENLPEGFSLIDV